jgi:DNA polymerase-3 subunit delta
MIALFYGPDEFARSETLAERRAALPPDLADLNMARLDGRRLKFDTLVSACEALPFLADRRLVIVDDLLKHQKAGKERDELRAYLERVPDSCELIFVEHDDVDKRNGLFVYLKKIGAAREFTPRSGADLLRWLAERARILEVRLDPPAAQKLVDMVGGEGRPLVNELSKMASYVGRGGRITPETVDLLVTDGQEQNLFAFIDDLSLRRRGPALRRLRALLDEGQAGMAILAMVSRQVRTLLNIQELVARRVRPDEMASQIGLAPFLVRKALDQVRGFTPAELVALHDRILELDQATKTGRAQADTALELLVVEVCGGSGAQPPRNF